MPKYLKKREKTAGTTVQQSLAWFFSNWLDSSTVAGTIIQQSLARLFNRRWHNYSTLLIRLFNSHWHNYSTVAGMILQQSLVWLFNSDWHDCSTVTGIILQQLLARLFNSQGQDFFSFFYAGRILQQWCSLLKNRAMYQECETWSITLMQNGWYFLFQPIS